MTARKRPFSANLKMLPIYTFMNSARLLGQSDRLMAKMTSVEQSPERKQKVFADYEPTEHDLFVCSYSKSGTNWTMQIAQQIAYYGAAEFDNIYDLIAWPDFSLPVDMAQLDDDTIQQKSPTGLRLIKTHLESDYVPYKPDAKYIVVVRDPKDTFVSGYYFGLGMMNMLGAAPSEDINMWFDLFTTGKSFYGSWPAMVASYWPWRDRDSVLFVTFAELKQDLRQICQRAADLMQVSLTETQLNTVIEKSSFQYMKNINHKFVPPFPPYGIRSQPEVIRSGKKGSAKELLTPAQQAQIDTYCQEELKRLGSDFPYTDIFATQTP